jgi:hypothetical protein
MACIFAAATVRVPEPAAEFDPFYLCYPVVNPCTQTCVGASGPHQDIHRNLYLAVCSVMQCDVVLTKDLVPICRHEVRPALISRLAVLVEWSARSDGSCIAASSLVQSKG